MATDKAYQETLDQAWAKFQKALASAERDREDAIHQAWATYAETTKALVGGNHA